MGCYPDLYNYLLGASVTSAHGVHQMTTIIIKSVPPGDFKEISIHTPGWKARFLELVQQEQPIKYDAYTMPNLSTEVQDQLSKYAYSHLILDSDRDHHFLVPRTAPHEQHRL